MNRLQIDRSRQAVNSPPTLSPAQTGGFSRTEGDLTTETPRHFIRERCVVIGFVATAAIAIGAWLWLLGWIAISIL
jgi:hypothetical protein